MEPYECYECRLCLERYENPVKCPKCKEDFCKKHIDSKNICPVCGFFPFFKVNLNSDSMYKCNVCKGYEIDENSFLRHVIEKHKEEIILKFREKDTPTPNKDNNTIYDSQNININPSYNNNINNKNKQKNSFRLESLSPNNLKNSINDNKSRAFPKTTRNYPNMKQNNKFSYNNEINSQN